MHVRGLVYSGLVPTLSAYRVAAAPLRPAVSPVFHPYAKGQLARRTVPMDGNTADPKPAAPVRTRVRAIVVGNKTADPAYRIAPPEAVNPETVGNHFLETMEKIREKNREVAAARAGNLLIRNQAVKLALHLPDPR